MVAAVDAAGGLGAVPAGPLGVAPDAQPVTSSVEKVRTHRFIVCTAFFGIGWFFFKATVGPASPKVRDPPAASSVDCR